MRPILDIITVTKNDLEGVSATINSTRLLRTLGVRQIIVDSSDELTALQIKALIDTEKNITYSWQEPVGISAAFNAGLSLSDSEWVWFLNGRDQVHTDLKLTMFLDILRTSHADLLIFELEFMQSRGCCTHPPMWALWPPVQFWIPHPATLVRRNLFELYGQFDERYKIAMDGEIWFRFISNHIIVDMLSFPISFFDEGGVSRLHYRRTAKEGRQIITNNLLMLLKYWLHNGWLILKSYWMFYKKSR